MEDGEDGVEPVEGVGVDVEVDGRSPEVAVDHVADFGWDTEEGCGGGEERLESLWERRCRRSERYATVRGRREGWQSFAVLTEAAHLEDVVRAC